MPVDDVLVVGASGYLGRSVVATLRDAGHDVVGTYCSNPSPTADVQFDVWTDDLAPLVEEHADDAVVFAAAPEYPKIDTGTAAAGPDFEAVAERLATACRDRRLVYVSSAGLFDGIEGNYPESAERSPIDAYGRRLVTMEDAVREVCEDFAILRTSYLYGFSAGRLDDRLARTRDAVSAGEPVAYFDDMYKSPVLVTEAAEAIAALVAHDPGESDATGVVHVPAPRMSVYEFHRDAMDALGYDSSLVERDAMPDDRTLDPETKLAPDRSLASDRFASLVGFEPSTVKRGLQRQLEER